VDEMTTFWKKAWPCFGESWLVYCSAKENPQDTAYLSKDKVDGLGGRMRVLVYICMVADKGIVRLQ
jgi:hypothetical protein